MVRLSYEVFHRDVTVLVDFYRNVLAFDRSQVAGGEDHVVLRRGEVRVACCRHPDAPVVERRPPDGTEIALRVADVKSEHDRVRATGWPVADTLQQRPWGMTDFRIFDPSGQYLRITGD